MVECWVVDPDVDGFSGNLLGVLIYYFDMGDVVLGGGCLIPCLCKLY